LVELAVTVTEVGIEAIAADPLTTVSATGMSTAAGAFKVTVPVPDKPPWIGVGLTVTLDGVGGNNFRLAVAV